VIGLCFPNLPFPNNKLFEGEGGCHKKKVIDMNYYPTKNFLKNQKFLESLKALELIVMASEFT
jgi:hypothetical protein